MTYPLFKMLHIFGVVIFLGNIIVTGVWKVCADKIRDPHIAAFGQRLVTLTDWIFTFPGVMIILLTGLHMAQSWGGISAQSWIKTGLTLFLISGIIWVVILIPIQIKQAHMAKRFDKDLNIPSLYWKLNWFWVFFGTIATILPLCNLYFMVIKP
jgi:uncharacterized membrane protein